MRGGCHGHAAAEPMPSFGERYLSTPLFQNLWVEDDKTEQSMPTSWRTAKRIGVKPLGERESL